MTGGRGDPALAAGLRSLRSLHPAAKAVRKTPGGVGEARRPLPLNVCNFQLPKVLNFRLPLTSANLQGAQHLPAQRLNAVRPPLNGAALRPPKPPLERQDGPPAGASRNEGLAGGASSTLCACASPPSGSSHGLPPLARPPIPDPLLPRYLRTSIFKTTTLSSSEFHAGMHCSTSRRSKWRLTLCQYAVHAACPKTSVIGMDATALF